MISDSPRFIWGPPAHGHAMCTRPFLSSKGLGTRLCWHKLHLLRFLRRGLTSNHRCTSKLYHGSHTRVKDTAGWVNLLLTSQAQPQVYNQQPQVLFTSCFIHEVYNSPVVNLTTMHCHSISNLKPVCTRAPEAKTNPIICMNHKLDYSS